MTPRERAESMVELVDRGDGCWSMRLKGQSALMWCSGDLALMRLRKEEMIFSLEKMIVEAQEDFWSQPIENWWTTTECKLDQIEFDCNGINVVPLKDWNAWLDKIPTTHESKQLQEGVDFSAQPKAMRQIPPFKAKIFECTFVENGTVIEVDVNEKINEAGIRSLSGVIIGASIPNGFYFHIERVGQFISVGKIPNGTEVENNGPYTLPNDSVDFSIQPKVDDTKEFNLVRCPKCELMVEELVMTPYRQVCANCAKGS